MGTPFWGTNLASDSRQGLNRYKRGYCWHKGALTGRTRRLVGLHYNKTDHNTDDSARFDVPVDWLTSLHGSYCWCKCNQINSPGAELAPSVASSCTGIPVTTCSWHLLLWLLLFIKVANRFFGMDVLEPNKFLEWSAVIKWSADTTVVSSLL